MDTLMGDVYYVLYQTLIENDSDIGLDDAVILHLINRFLKKYRAGEDFDYDATAAQIKEILYAYGI
jgi:hypothetical protein